MIGLGEHPSPLHLEQGLVLRICRIVEGQPTFLIGGQALNIWAEHYARLGVAGLDEWGPFTSKDIDFAGKRPVAEFVAQSLGGELRYPGWGDHTPTVAIVTATLNGRIIEIDFLDTVLGIAKPNQLERSAETLIVPTKDGPDLEINLLEPLGCLKSRVANVATLRRREPTALRQLNAAVIINAAHLKEILDVYKDARGFHRRFRALFSYLRKSNDLRGLWLKNLLQVHPLYGLNELVDSDGLSPIYRELTLMPMMLILNKRYQNYAPIAEV